MAFRALAEGSKIEVVVLLDDFFDVHSHVL
jgi:hypothetical protein